MNESVAIAGSEVHAHSGRGSILKVLPAKNPNPSYSYVCGIY